MIITPVLLFKQNRAILQLIILDRISLHLLYRVLCRVFNHLCSYNIVCIQSQLIQHVLAINDYIRQLLFDMLRIIIRVTPLKTFQQLVCLNGYALRQIAGE